MSYCGGYYYYDSGWDAYSNGGNTYSTRYQYVTNGYGWYSYAYEYVDACDDAVVVDEDGSATLNVLNNDIGLYQTGSNYGYCKSYDDLEVVAFAGQAIGSVVTLESNGGRTVNVTMASDGTLTVVPSDDFDELNDGESDSVTVSYKITNGYGGFDTAFITVTVTGTTDAPIVSIISDFTSTTEDEAVTINVLDNDIDGGDALVVASASFNGQDFEAGETFDVTSDDGRTGTITIEADGTLTFDGDASFISLGAGETDTVTITYAAGTASGLGENLIVNGDFENNPLYNSGWTTAESIQGWTSPYGHIEIQESNFGTGNTAGNAVIELDAHYNSTIRQVVSIDEAGPFVLSVDYAPRGTNFATNGFGIRVNGQVVATVNPTESGFQTETVELDLAAGNAVIEFFATGTSDSIGTVIDNVSLRAANEIDVVGEATVTIEIDGVNDGPVAADDAGAVTEAADGTFEDVVGNVLTNDSDADVNDVLSVASVEGVAGDVGQTITVLSDVNGFAATVSIGANGDLVVSAGAEFAALNDGENDTVTITYEVSDGNGGTDEAEAVITINGVGAAFEIADDALSVLENESVSENVLGNDSSEDALQVYSFAGVDAGETAEVTSADGRTAFVTVGLDGTLSFTADGDFDSLAVGQSDTVTFSYAAGTGVPRGENLVSNGDFEENPLANTGSVIVDEIDSWVATAGNIEVQESDFGSGNTEGNAVIELDSNLNATIEQTVTVTEAGEYVFSLDYAMTGSDSATNGFGVRINGTEVAAVFPTEVGFQTFEANVTLGVGDATIEIFGLGASDGIGSVIDNVALQTAGTPGQQGAADVTITIDGVNDGPVAVADAETANENIDGEINVVTGNVLANDSDVDTGDVLTVTAVNGVAGNVNQVLNVISDVNNFAATAVIEADGSITVAPSEAFAALGGGESDTITLTYEVSDGNGGVDVAEVVITVNGADNGVAAENDAVSVLENENAVINILDNDAGGPGLTVDSVAGNAVGTPFIVTTDGGRQLEVNFAASGLLTVTAGASFDELAQGATDTVRLDYTASDGAGSFADAFVDVTIVGVNDDIRVFVDEDEPIEVNQGSVGTGNVFIIDRDGAPGLVDIDGDAAVFEILSQGEFTTATVDANTGEITFAGDFGFFGEDSFEFRVSDGLSFDTGTVFVDIVNIGQSPVIDETASDLSVGASSIGGFLNATGVLTAFDADDFDFDAFGNQFPDAVLEISVRAGVQVEAFGLADTDALIEAVGEAGATLEVGELTGTERVTDFDFNLNEAELFDFLGEFGLDAASLATASVDLTYTLEVTDNTASTFNTTTELTVTLDSADLLGLFA